MIQLLPFYVNTPDSEPWRVVLCPNVAPTPEDLILVAKKAAETPLWSHEYITVEQLPDSRLKVSLTPQITQRMKSGKLSAVSQKHDGEKWVNSSVSLDVVTITDRIQETDPSGIIEAFVKTLEPIELSTLK